MTRLPEEWKEAIEDVWWAEKFHWTPEQVEALPYERSERLRITADALDTGAEKRHKEESKPNGGGPG